MTFHKTIYHAVCNIALNSFFIYLAIEKAIVASLDLFFWKADTYKAVVNY